MPGVVYCFNKIVEKPAHAQTVDTRPFFSPSAPPCACKKGAGSRLVVGVLVSPVGLAIGGGFVNSFFPPIEA